jgi:ribose transport system permease protein
MRVIDNGINMFQMYYVDDDGINRIWRLNPNWTFVIIGTVILVAVVLDQVVHIVQAKRRIRRASALATAEGPSPAAVATPPPKPTEAD